MKRLFSRKTTATSTNSLKSISMSNGNSILGHSKEDALLHIDNLSQYFRKRSKKIYKTKKFGDSPLPKIDNTIQIPSDFKLYAVFDGHCGQIAAEFLRHRLPHQLVTNPHFKAKQYELALKDSLEILHKELISSDAYVPEGVDYASGSTASVVLVSKETTYFAFLGDSPIIIWDRSKPEPELLFEEHDCTNDLIVDNLIESNIFLVLIREAFNSLTYFLLSDPNTKEKVLTTPKLDLKNNEASAHLHYDDMRVGLAALNVYASIGDSCYDPEVFNKFVDEIVSFRASKFSRTNTLGTKESEATITNTPSMESPETIYDYNEFVEFVKSRPNFEFLSKHMALVKRKQYSRVLQAAIKHLQPENKITTAGLLRSPQTTSRPTEELRLILIASDGVVRFWPQLGYMYRGIIKKYWKNLDLLCKIMEGWIKWVNDDRTLIALSFGEKSTDDCNGEEISIEDSLGLFVRLKKEGKVN